MQSSSIDTDLVGFEHLRVIHVITESTLQVGRVNDEKRDTQRGRGIDTC